MSPGFSERNFEFCFNAELCKSLKGLLASHPFIPSQQMEKSLGYDVEFKLHHGSFKTSVFLQHKVSHFAERLAGKNERFYRSYNAPYYRFSIDNDQHNTLHDLSANRGNAFYCAPIFYSTTHLETYFFSGLIGDNSIWLDPVHVGSINDSERHNITYSAAGTNPILHSQPRPFTNGYRASLKEMPKLKEQKIDRKYIEDLSEDLSKRTVDSKFKKEYTKAVERLKPVEKTQYLLGHVYHVSWILIS
jgi:hypothetical protein